MEGEEKRPYPAILDIPTRVCGKMLGSRADCWRVRFVHEMLELGIRPRLLVPQLPQTSGSHSLPATQHAHESVPHVVFAGGVR